MSFPDPIHNLSTRQCWQKALQSVYTIYRLSASICSSASSSASARSVFEGVSFSSFQLFSPQYGLSRPTVRLRWSQAASHRDDPCKKSLGRGDKRISKVCRKHHSDAKGIPIFLPGKQKGDRISLERVVTTLIYLAAIRSAMPV